MSTTPTIILCTERTPEALKDALTGEGWAVEVHADVIDQAPDTASVIVLGLDRSTIGYVARLKRPFKGIPIIALTADGYAIVGASMTIAADDPMAVVQAVSMALKVRTGTAETDGQAKSALTEALLQKLQMREAQVEAQAKLLEQEVAQRKLAQGDANAAKEAAQVAAQSKSAFLANISHELRTPLNAILGYTELLLEEASQDAPHWKADLQHIRESGARLLGMIDDILDLARIESGKVQILASPVRLDELVDDCLQVAQPLAQRNNNTLLIDRPDDLGLILTDRRKLRQCVLNVLANASKFTENGTIAFSVRRVTDTILFEVRDTGIGIPDDQLDRIFGDFSKVDMSTNPDHPGAGLGLAITRSLVRRMGGDVKVDSRVGQGSTFTLIVPTETEESLRTPTPLPLPTNRVKPPIIPEGKPVVLAIDDDPLTTKLMRSILEVEGYAVIVANSAVSGLHLAAQHPPSLITLDVVMPEMDGWETLRHLKGGPLQHVPVVMVSMADEREKCAQLGAADHLLKPITRTTLSSIVRRHIL